MILRERTVRFERPLLLGILNITPDSFSDGGQYNQVGVAVERARALVEAGADLLDIGGESTRPGSAGVSAEEELQRVLPVVEALVAAKLDVPISVDTSKASVARAALAAGAHLINDVTALADPELAPAVAEYGAGLILMHMRGEPRTMQAGPIHYDDVVGEVKDHLEKAIARAVGAGVARERLMVDPGIGFGKTVEHNLVLTRRLSELGRLGVPVVYGPSRKSFLGALTGRPVQDRDRATAAACAVAVIASADVLRVHDVIAVKDAVVVATALRDAV
jgi:dihydropteroate synthase